jgi:hypothetical protein
VTSSIGSRMEPATSVRVLYAGGPWDGRQETLEVPGGIPTILPVDAPLPERLGGGLLPAGRWRISVWAPLHE